MLSHYEDFLVRLTENMQARCAKSFQRDLFSVSLIIHSHQSVWFAGNDLDHSGLLLQIRSETTVNSSFQIPNSALNLSFAIVIPTTLSYNNRV